jgi:hypothetical protein
MHEGMRNIVIPPILSILLDICRTREEIPERLIQLRDDFTETRNTLTMLETDFSRAGTLGEQLEALDKFDSTWITLASKLKVTDRKTLYKIWTVIQEGSPVKMLASSADKVILNVEERKVLAKVKGFVDMWHKCMNIRTYDKLIQKVFKKSLLTNRKFLKEFMTFNEYVSKFKQTGAS